MAKNPIAWDHIIRQIKNEKCVLMLGPDLVTLGRNQTLSESLKDHIYEKNGKDLAYYHEDELFAFQSDFQKMHAYVDIQVFYEMIEPHEVYEKLSNIPFHLIISLSPDVFLRDCFEKLGYAFQFDYYKKGKPTPKIEIPGTRNPLVYNMLGSVEDDFSMIFSYDDLFDYLLGIAGDFQLPDILRDTLNKSRHLIFLGFKYHKWYLKLLLRLLGLHKDKLIDACSRVGEIDDQLYTFYTRNFNANFVETDIKNFVDELYAHCEERGLLRSRYEVFDRKNLIEAIHNYVQGNNLRGAIEALRSASVIKGSEVDNAIILILSRFNDHENKIRSGTLRMEEINVESNRIKESILGILDVVSRLDS